MRRLLYLLVIASSVFFASSCTGDKRAEPTPSSSVTPTVTEPTYPPEAEGTDVEAAANFVAYYIDLFEYSFASGDTRKLHAVSAIDCNGCNAFIALIDETHGDGGYFKGVTTLGENYELEPTPDGQFIAYVTVQFGEGEYASNSEAVAEELPATSAEWVLTMESSGQSWSVLELNRGAS